jgi:competence ComEA-like helix-hairpin-helix protein
MAKGKRSNGSKSPLWGLLPRLSIQLKDKRLIAAVLVLMVMVAIGYGTWSLYGALSADPAPADQDDTAASETRTGPNNAEAGLPANAAAAFPVDINTADVPTLTTLPNIGPVLAERIVAYRAEHSRFTSIEELGEVEGIGPKTLEGLRGYVVVG